MRKNLGEGTIKLSDIVIGVNFRERTNMDVKDLHSAIAENKLIHNISIRKKDNLLICGHRRYKAYKDLNKDTIPCTFWEADDNEVIAMNIEENDKRKNTNTVSKGYGLYKMKQNGMSEPEISELMHYSLHMTKALILTYEKVIGTPYEKYVIEGKRTKGINPSLIASIHGIFMCLRRDLSKKDWEIILDNMVKGKLTTRLATQLKKLAASNKDMPIQELINVLSTCKVVELVLPMNVMVLNKSMQVEKYSSESEYLKDIIRKNNKNLFY